MDLDWKSENIASVEFITIMELCHKSNNWRLTVDRPTSLPTCCCERVGVSQHGGYSIFGGGVLTTITLATHFKWFMSFVRLFFAILPNKNHNANNEPNAQEMRNVNVNIGIEENCHSVKIITKKKNETATHLPQQVNSKQEKQEFR